MRDTFTEWIETFTAKPWYRAFALLVMIVIAIDVWRDRGLVVGVLACSLLRRRDRVGAVRHEPECSLGRPDRFSDPLVACGRAWRSRSG
jgi:hypothetical protein